MARLRGADPPCASQASCLAAGMAARNASCRWGGASQVSGRQAAGRRSTAAGCLGRECGTELRLAAGAAQEDHHYLRDLEGQRSAKIFFHEGEIDAGRDSG
jgi:hypothetical protein